MLFTLCERWYLRCLHWLRPAGWGNPARLPPCPMAARPCEQSWASGTPLFGCQAWEGNPLCPTWPQLHLSPHMLAMRGAVTPTPPCSTLQGYRHQDFPLSLPGYERICVLASTSPHDSEVSCSPHCSLPYRGADTDARILPSPTPTACQSFKVPSSSFWGVTSSTPT